MHLRPLEEFVVARGLENHLDNTTYYVRAVIRNAKTDALIATLDLTDQGDSHRFTKKWQVPQDPTGQGFWILVTTSVYTDSGYTTKAENYGDKYEEHLIEERPTGFHGGGGPDIDYKRIRKIAEEVVQAQLATLPKPEKVDMPNMAFHLQPVLNAISGLRKDIQGVELPETDFSGIEFRLSTLEKAIKAIRIPETDISPVLDAIQELQETVRPATEKGNEAVGAMLERMKSFFSQDIETIKKQVGQVNKKLAQMPFLMLGTPKPEEKEQEQVDYSQLLS